MKFICISIFLIFGSSFASYTSKELKCEVCKATIEEMEKKIEQISPKKKIQIGGYRVDNTGNLQEKSLPFARSSMHLSELMDEICETMKDYARATDKKTGKLELLKLVSGGGMNPRMSEVDLIQDSDLNKSLTFHCESIVEEFEDEIYNELKQSSPDPVYSVCTTATSLCNDESVKGNILDQILVQKSKTVNLYKRCLPPQ